jgi:hypothetical protein
MTTAMQAPQNTTYTGETLTSLTTCGKKRCRLQDDRAIFTTCTYGLDFPAPKRLHNEARFSTVPYLRKNNLGNIKDGRVGDGFFLVSGDRWLPCRLVSLKNPALLSMDPLVRAASMLMGGRFGGNLLVGNSFLRQLCSLGMLLAFLNLRTT